MRTRARLLLSTAFSLALSAAQAQGFGGIRGLSPSSPCGGHPGYADNGCAGSNANTPTVSGNVNLLGTTADPHIDGSPCHTTNY